jgi:DNA polymerase-3 subunit beta
MKFICSQSILSNAINTVQKAVSTKSTHPILKGILIEAHGNTLKLTGNDLNIGIECLIEADIREEGSIVVSSRLFGEIIRKLPDSDIEIMVDEQNQVHIHCEKSKFNLLGQPSAEFPELPELGNTEVCDLDCDLFKNMIRQTLFATSQDETRPILTGCLIEIEQGTMTMVAIDGYRLALRTASVNPNASGRAVIPGKTLSEVGKIISNLSEEDLIRLAFTDKHILFEVGSVRVISRLLEGEFIKYGQIIPKDNKTKVIVKTNEILNSIERASLLARESKNSSIKISVKKDYLSITSNVEIGSADEEVAIQLDGPELEIGFNPKYLVDALKIMDSEEIHLEFSTSVSPCIMKPADYLNYTYLVLPVRLS